MVRCRPMIAALPDDVPRVSTKAGDVTTSTTRAPAVAYFAFAVRFLKSTSVAAAR